MAFWSFSMARKTKPDDPAIAVGDRDRHIPAGPPVDRETLMPGYRPRQTMLVKRGDLKNGEMQPPEGTMIVRPQDCVTRAEAEAGAYWSHSGGGIMIKVSAEEANATRARLLARFETIHARLLAEPDAVP